MDTTRIIYFGTAPFAVPSLAALASDDGRYEIVAVVSQPDRPAGRKGELKESAVTAFARENYLDLFQPESVKDDTFIAALRDLRPDIFVVAAYGRIIPKNILDIPPLGALNLHGSILPKYRGASPIQAAILNGETETGVSLMRMDEKMDHGPVYATATVPISTTDTYSTLEESLAKAAARLLTESLPAIIDGSLEPKGQDHDAATFTAILKKEDGAVSWADETAQEIERKVRAFDPWPGCHFMWERKGTPIRIRILDAEAVEGDGIPAATLTHDDMPAVVTRSGILVLRSVQPQGKRAMRGEEFLRGYPDFIG